MRGKRVAVRWQYVARLPRERHRRYYEGKAANGHLHPDNDMRNDRNNLPFAEVRVFTAVKPIVVCDMLAFLSLLASTRLAPSHK
jgi:hypothetical protein